VGYVTAITHLSSTQQAARFVDHRAVALSEYLQEACTDQAPRHPTRLRSSPRLLMPSPSSRCAKIHLEHPPWTSREKLEQGFVHGDTRVETPAYGLETLSSRIEENLANVIVCCDKSSTTSFLHSGSQTRPSSRGRPRISSPFCELDER
jgi:hypothetical protein